MTSNTSGRLRLKSLAASVAVSSCSLLGASLARAVTTITRQQNGVTTVWSSIQTETGADVFIVDALLSTATSSRPDAFDSAFLMFAGSPSGGFEEGSSFVIEPGTTVVDNSPQGGTVSGTARSAPFDGAALAMAWSLAFSPDAARVDGTFVVTNDSDSAFEGHVSLFSNFGSDDFTVIEDTSSSDNLLDDDDRWIVTSDQSGEAPGFDPVILSAIGNEEAVVGQFTDVNEGRDNLVWRVNVNLAPGESVTIEATHCLFETISEALEAARSGQCGEEEPGGALEPPPAPTPAPPPPTPVPVMTNPALLGLAIATGLLGVGALRRRRKTSEP